MLERSLRLIQSRRGLLSLAALALFLSLPAFALGLISDDYLHLRNVVAGQDPAKLFYTAPADVLVARDNGSLVWWSSPSLCVKFFRPLASILHTIEFRYWPNAAWAMHLHNSVIYALLVVVAALLYRELMPDRGRVAALASLLFALNEGHSPSVGWISGRNTILAGLFALIALLLQIRARSGAQRPAWLLRAASALSVGLALLSAEAGLAILAYLIAYVLIFESGSWQRRLLSITPQLAVIAAWAIAYRLGGYGAQGTSFYRDLARPLSVLSEGLLDLPLWLFGALGPGLVGTAMAAPAAAARAIALLLVLPLVAAMIIGTPRTRLNGFFALAALLCLPPLFTTQPQERLLLIASLGVCGLLASFIDAAAQHASRLVRGTRPVMIGLHLVLAPLLFFGALGQSRPFENGTRAMLAVLPEELPSQVIFLNTPIELLGLYTWNHLQLRDAQLPRAHSLHQLYTGSSDLTVKRIDANTLELRPGDGWGRIPLERIFGAKYDLPQAGTQVDVQAMQVSVAESNAEGRPSRVQFHFPSALESTERLWFAWQGKAPKPWRPPAIGEEVTFPGRLLFQSLEF
jgi:hypothetical protein